MKSINKLISACALLLVATVYSAEQQRPPEGYGSYTPEEPAGKQEESVGGTQNITIINGTGLNINAKIYLTNLLGTRTYQDTYVRPIGKDGKCLTFIIKKPADKKRKEFHRILVVESSNDNPQAKSSSKMIEWFSGGKALTYKVTANKGKLSISREKKMTCTSSEEPIKLSY